jgi:hypothetical protein
MSNHLFLKPLKMKKVNHPVPGTFSQNSLQTLVYFSSKANVSLNLF